MDEYAEIDIGNQIDNSWKKDTALALKKGKFCYTLKIKEEYKKRIKKSFIQDGERYKKNNRKVVVMTYTFLLYKLLDNLDGMCNQVRLCNDINPATDFYRYLRAIFTYYRRITPLDEEIRIRFQNKEHGKSKAHKKANSTYKGRNKPNYLIKKKDLEDLFNLIENKCFG